jgi:hypothetical protein
MRDIRPDLRQRLSRIARERDKMHQRLRELETRQRNLETLLADEESKFNDEQQLPLFDDTPNRRTTRAGVLREFVAESLSDGRQASLSDLMRLACGRGILEPHASARALNMTLINLYRRGLIERLPSGLWCRAKAPESQKPSHGTQLELNN